MARQMNRPQEPPKYCATVTRAALPWKIGQFCRLLAALRRATSLPGSALSREPDIEGRVSELLGARVRLRAGTGPPKLRIETSRPQCQLTGVNQTSPENPVTVEHVTPSTQAQAAAARAGSGVSTRGDARPVTIDPLPAIPSRLDSQVFPDPSSDAPRLDGGCHKIEGTAGNPALCPRCRVDRR